MKLFNNRFTTIEEKRNQKKTLIYIVLSIIIIVAFIYLGIPGLAKLASFVGDFKKGEEPIEINDTTPPAPPQLEDLPEFTNKANLKIKGSAEPGSTVKLFINDSSEEVLSDKDGQFNFSTNLKKGENKISALAKDTTGNEGSPTSEKTVIFDDLPPDLEITAPTDGTSFYGSLQRQIVIEGKTEEQVSISINNRVVVVESDGRFSFATTLVEGDNNFNIKATDRAGNETTKGITFHYWK